MFSTVNSSDGHDIFQDAELFFVVTGTLSVLQQAVGKETDKEVCLMTWCRRDITLVI